MAAPACDRRATSRELVARLSEQHFRGLKAASLRVASAASLPVWFQAQWGLLPDLLAFWAVLLQGSCLVVTVAFAALEYRWQGRAARLEARASPSPIHTLWSSWDELRSSLWYGLTVISLVPWAYVAFGRPFPRPLLSASVAVGVAVFLLVVVAESVPRLRPADGDAVVLRGEDGDRPAP